MRTFEWLAEAVLELWSSLKVRDLLTDGAGFIGSHIAERLLVRGPEVAVADDPSTGNDENVPERRRDFYEMDIRSGCAEAPRTSNPRCSGNRPPRWTPGAPCASRPSARTST